MSKNYKYRYLYNRLNVLKRKIEVLEDFYIEYKKWNQY